jgi:hypothetical protein
LFFALNLSVMGVQGEEQIIHRRHKPFYKHRGKSLMSAGYFNNASR